MTQDCPPVGLAAYPDQRPEPPFGQRQSGGQHRSPGVRPSSLLQEVRSLWRQRFLISALTILGTLLAIFLALKSPPQYMSDAMVRVVAASSDNLSSPNVVPAVAVEHGTVETESRIIASRANVVRALARLDQIRPPVGPACYGESVWNRVLRRLTTELHIPIGFDCASAPTEAQDTAARERRINGFQRRLQAAPSGQSALVTLSYTSEDPQLARAFLDAVITSYLDEQVAQKRQMITRRRNVQDARIEGLSSQLDRASRSIAIRGGTRVASTAGIDHMRYDLDQRRNELDSRIAERARLDDQLALIEPDARVISLASPALPASPSIGTFMLLGLVGSVVAACMVAFTLDRLDTRLCSQDDLEQALGVPCGGLVPKIAIRPEALEERLRTHPNSLFARALRGILASIPVNRFKVVLVTSSVPGEGVTTLTSGLAILAVASTRGERILLISLEGSDEPVRRGQELPSADGAKALGDASFIAGMTLERSGTAGYDILRADPDRPLDVGIIQVLRAALAGLRNQYDLILIDAPAVFAGPEATVLASLADIVLLVVRWGRTDRSVICRSLKQLAPSAYFMTILSRVDVRKHRRYGFSDALSVPTNIRGSHV